MVVFWKQVFDTGHTVFTDFQHMQAHVQAARETQARTSHRLVSCKAPRNRPLKPPETVVVRMSWIVPGLAFKQLLYNKRFCRLLHLSSVGQVGQPIFRIQLSYSHRAIVVHLMLIFYFSNRKYKNCMCNYLLFAPTGTLVVIVVCRNDHQATFSDFEYKCQFI